MEEGKYIASFLDALIVVCKPKVISVTYKRVQNKSDKSKINLRKSSDPEEFPWIRKTIQYANQGILGKGAFSNLQHYLRTAQVVAKELVIITSGRHIDMTTSKELQIMTLFGIPIALYNYDILKGGPRPEILTRLVPGKLSHYSVLNVPVFDGRSINDKDRKTIRTIKNVFDAISLPF